MAKTGKNHLRRWEYPAGSSIRVREIINRYGGVDSGLSYRVTIPARLAGKRRFKQFTNVEAAEAWAKDQHDGILKDGQKHFKLTPAERDDALLALSALEGTGLSLSQAAALAKKHHRPSAGQFTVRQIVDKLLAEKEAENLRQRSLGDLRNRLDIFCQSFGEHQIKDVTHTDFEQWLRDLRGISAKSSEGLSARSKKNYLVTIRTFFNYAIAKGYHGTENPTANISTPKIDWQLPSILTVKESHRLLTAARSEQKGKLLPAVILGLFAGIRSNEITRLDWSAIDLDEGILTIGPEIAKKRRLRVLELMPNCIAWLKTIPNRQGRVAPAKFPMRWTVFVKKAGFPDWGENRSNAMRHSFGSYHYALYSDAAKTSAMLGHRTNDQVLFDSYRSLARKKDADEYFGILPEAAKKAKPTTTKKLR
ncbi:MAG: phage integrase SAM-like domain-containing protein [Opitutaceae bacterium]|jgi:integrase